PCSLRPVPRRQPSTAALRQALPIYIRCGYSRAEDKRDACSRLSPAPAAGDLPPACSEACLMRLFNALLHLYPASFRGEYGAEMGAIFRQRRQAAAGPLEVAGLWAETLSELPGNALAVHWDLLRQDLRFAARTLGRSPGFAATALLILALGIGANTAAFSVTDFVLIRPLPFRDPQRLVKLWESPPGYSRTEPSPANYRDWKRMSKAFAAMGAFHGISVNLVGQGDPVRLEGSAVTADLFPLLGAWPLLGRLFTAAEDRAGTAGTLVLSYPLWQNDFGGH